jgi:hypothetical protein
MNARVVPEGRGGDGGSGGGEGAAVLRGGKGTAGVLLFLLRAGRCRREGRRHWKRAQGETVRLAVLPALRSLPPHAGKGG